VVGAAGVTQTLVFHQPGDLKYIATVLGPLLVLVAASAAKPLDVLVPAIVFIAPFGAFVMTLSGIHVSALAVVVAIAAGAAVVSVPPMRRTSAVGTATLSALVLLLVPVVSGTAGRSTLTVLAALVVVSWLVSRAARTDRGLKAILWAFLGSATIQAVIAIWEFKTGHLLNLYGSAGNHVFGVDYFFGFGSKNRPVGSFFDPNSLGNVLALACPIALGLVASSGALRLRVLAAAAGTVVAVGLALSLSRDSWIAAAAGVIVAVLCLPPATRRAAVVPSVAAGALVAALALGSSGGVLASRFASITNPTGTGVRTAQGDRIRMDDWDTALSAFSARPAFGVGFGNLLPRLYNEAPASSPSSNAQSTYLQVLAEAGIAGALALLVVLGALGHELLAGLRRERLVLAGVAGSTVALLICWLTDVTIRYVSVAAMFAVVFGVVASRARRTPSP
jgi:O-antigen ligase